MISKTHKKNDQKTDFNSHEVTKPPRFTKGTGMQNQKLRRSLMFVAPSAWRGNRNDNR